MGVLNAIAQRNNVFVADGAPISISYQDPTNPGVIVLRFILSWSN